MMYGVQIIAVTTLIVAVTCQSTTTDSEGSFYKKGTHIICSYDIEICQKCAKETKSEIAYPYCCENKEGVFRWCRAYVGFGLHKRSGKPQMKKLKCHRFPYLNPYTLRKEVECLCPNADQKRVECSRKAHSKQPAVDYEYKLHLHTNQLGDNTYN